MNATTKAIIERLPHKPLLSPADVAAAYGLATTSAILAAIRVGRLPANRIEGKFVISHSAAEKYIEANEFEPDEGTI